MGLFNRNRPTPEQVEGMREAFWSDQPKPLRIPDTPEARRTYERWSYTHGVADDALAIMKDQAITPAALAEEMGTSEVTVQRMLSGGELLEATHIAGIAAGLRAHLEVTVVPAVGGKWENSAESNNPSTEI